MGGGSSKEYAEPINLNSNEKEKEKKETFFNKNDILPNIYLYIGILLIFLIIIFFILNKKRYKD